MFVSIFFFFNATATTEIYTLSLHDALPISSAVGRPDSGELSSDFRALQLAESRESIAVDRKSTRLNSSHVEISYAVFCLKKKTHRYATMKGMVCLAIGNLSRRFALCSSWLR